MLSSSDRDRIVIAAVINSTTDVRADSFRVEVLRDRPAGARSLTVAGEPQSGRRDSNSGPPVPQTGALTRLRHAPRQFSAYQRISSPAPPCRITGNHDAFCHFLRIFCLN